MENSEIIERVRERARKNFSKGYNCAECIMEAVITNIDTGLPPEVMKLATGFGGGVGLFGDTCGAVTGAILAVGAVHGRSQLPTDADRKKAMQKATDELYGNPGLYRLFNQIPNQIKKRYGATLCREICEKWQDTWLCREHALHCREIITDAAGMAAELILNDRATSAAKPFGSNVEHLSDEGDVCTLGKG